MGRQFATLRADGSVYYPPTFDRSEEPYRVFSAPLMLYADGTRNPGRVPAGGWGGVGGGGVQSGASPVGDADCAPFGVNPQSGYCLLTNASLPYEEQMRQLPRAQPEKPYDAMTNPSSCDCDACTEVRALPRPSPALAPPYPPLPPATPPIYYPP